MNIPFVKLITVCAVATLLGGCAKSKVICGVEYVPYGLLNADDKKNPDIEYEVIWGNVFWGAVLAETVVAPIYFGGFSIFQPVGQKSKVKGAVATKSECAA